MNRYIEREDSKIERRLRKELKKVKEQKAWIDQL
jgi:hypothetical protein